MWADDVRALDEGVHPASIRPAKGVHITVPWELVQNDAAAIVPSARDDRSVFVIPWDGHTYIGTTDTEYDGSLDDPQCTEADAAYLLDALNGVTNVGAEPADIVGSWAGLRPLLATARHARTADLSRRHAVRVAPSGVVTVTGGKLTTYRRMAAQAVDAAVGVLDDGRPGSATRHLRLFGADGIEPGTAAADHLTGRYGTESAAVRALVDAEPGLGEPLVPGLAYLRCGSGVRGASRDGAHARRRARAADPGARARTLGFGGRGTGGRGAAGTRARMVRLRARTRGVRLQAVCGGRARMNLARARTTVVGVLAVVLVTTSSSLPAAATPTWPPLPAFDTNIAWSDCDNGWQCGTLTVPVDWRKPSSDTVGLALIRRPAVSPDERLGALVVNPEVPASAAPVSSATWCGGCPMPCRRASTS